MPRRALLIFATVAAFAVPATAQAVDTNAPKGARGDWLPRSEWVMSSWLPFDEQRLYDVLDTDRAELADWLDDRRTLGQLARARGHRSMSTLARTLLAPRLRTASPAMARRLRSRTTDMLTQAHLARHVVFHIYHTPAIPRHAQKIFGMSPLRYRKLRDSGMSPQGIAARGGRSAAQAREALRVLLRRRADQAARSGAMSVAQAAALSAHQEAGLGAYMVRRYRTPAQQVAFVCRLR